MCGNSKGEFGDSGGLRRFVFFRISGDEEQLIAWQRHVIV